MQHPCPVQNRLSAAVLSLSRLPLGAFSLHRREGAARCSILFIDYSSEQLVEVSAVKLRRIGKTHRV